jgi:hypothetical protein
MATTHLFAVPDRAHARALADALAGYGFRLVTARPLAGQMRFDPELQTWWGVLVFDDGRYPDDAKGRRQQQAVRRAAQTLAREHRGFWRMGGAMEWYERLAERFAPIVRSNRRARPAVPTLPPVRVPAPVVLPVDDPGPLSAGPARLPGLDDVPWASLYHAYGAADDVPMLLRLLCEDGPDWDENMTELVYGNVLHQGSCCPATAPTMRLLARLATAGTLPALRRLRLCADLLNAAGEAAMSTVRQADRAAAFGRPPAGDPFTDEVHAAVGEHVPDLLARWPAEPPATRLVLAALAGLYPEPGHAIGERIAAMRDEYGHTQPGAYLDLAAMLLAGRNDDALAAGQAIADWDDLHDIDTPSVAPAVRAASVLVEGVVSQVHQTLRQAG